MTLEKLFAGTLPQSKDRLVTGVTSDSREVQSGFVFVAVEGGSMNGHQFVETAVRKGAVAVVGTQTHEPLSVPYIQVDDSRKVLSQLASKFYGEPSLDLLVIGVTGTSGKTTTTYLVESILKEAGHRVGVIGTINIRFGNILYPSTLTTPGPVELQKILSQMKKDGCTAVVMEVSSHALKQHRVGNIFFDGMIFTNLTPEHLDFHPDMEDYFQSKLLLFTDLADESSKRGKKPVAIINSEDEYGRRLSSILSQRTAHPVRMREFRSEDLHFSLNGIDGKVDGIRVASSLTGKFNASNILGALHLGAALGLQPEAIARGINQLKGIPGRLEKVENSRGVHVWVDYAHEPDALEKVIRTLSEVKGSYRLITVFGCGGDRDRTKRPLMGKIAVQGSDQVWITSDNPRTEEPTAIIEEIVRGTQGASNFEIEVDRRKAIHKAIRSANPGDLVLIAGKGHEDYQIIGKQKIQFDDRIVAREADT